MRRARAWRRSLVVRTGAALALVGVLATLSVVVLFQFVDASLGKAAAINVAGSLRMHSYAIGVAVLEPARPDELSVRIGQAIAGFESRLHDPKLVSQIPPSPADPMRIAHRDLVAHWLRVRQALQAPSPGASRQAVLPALRGLVLEADRLVAMIQLDLEGRIEHHKMLGTATLLLMLAVLGSTFVYARRHLAQPLAALQRASRAIRAGGFSARVEAGEIGVSEFEELAAAFNRMAEDLSGMYGALEARVRDKTAELERSNRSLALLYDVAHRLSQPVPARESLTAALAGLRTVLGADSVSVCTGRDASVPAVTLAAVGGGCDPRVQAACASAAAGAPCGRACRDVDPALVDVPLVEGGVRYGTLALRLPAGRALEPWQRELAGTVGQHVAAALANASQLQSQQRLALLEERGAIARELHDSLAQSLSYLKIQVARLRSALAAHAPDDATAGGPPPAVAEVIDEIKGGLDAAYRQLRELLTTFRLRMDGSGLTSALRDTVDEYARRSGLAIDLEQRLADPELNANQQIHVLQTVREALSNVEKHARARRARVRLSRAADGEIVVVVDDDGVGIGHATSPTHHYGLAIMRDRAASLGGCCTITGLPDAGTRVELRFRTEPAAQAVAIA